MPKYELIPIEQLIEPEIPAREGMDEKKLDELCESVKEIGYVHPLAVVLVRSGQEAGEGGARRGHRAGRHTRPARFEIVDGHRRYKCGVMLSLKALPCLIFEDKDNAREAIKLHTALFREDLSTAEEAAFVADLINKYDYTEEQLCRALRQKPSWVNERLALLHGNKDVFNALRERKINFAVAKQLNRVKDEAHTRYLLDLCIQGGATAVTVASWVGEFLRPKPASGEQGAPGVAVTTADSSPAPGVSCFFCGKEDSPYQMENVWIHGWERQMIQSNLERAANVQPAATVASES
jgi:ParB/RepB/Spo0J family partition protein